MGDKIKTALEIAMEKLSQIEDLSEEEKENIKIKKEISPLMADFYSDKISTEDLLKKLKSASPSILTEVQLSVVESISYGNTEQEIKKRKDTAIAIEKLKKKNKSAFIDQSLSYLANLKKKAQHEREEVYNKFKNMAESNPESLYKEIDQGGRKMVIQLGIEEAINQNPQWQKFISESENQYEQEFRRVLDKLKSEINPQ